MQDETMPAERSGLYWAGRGLLGILSPPALILMLSMLGFAALARDAGLDWTHAAFMTATIWALPAQIILVGAITAGVALPAAALAVALSSMRLMPMVVSVAPEMRGRETKKRTLLFLSHFVAITGWVFALERMPAVPRDRRAAFFAGFAVPLTLVNTVIVAVAFNLMGQLPLIATGALAFLTPVYFLNSLYGSARELSGRIALFSGMALIPLGNWLSSGFDILIAGIGGGAIAFVAGRWFDRRRGAA